MTRDDIIDAPAYPGGPMPYVLEEHAYARDQLEAYARRAVLAEREACARLCEQHPWRDGASIPSNHELAAAIRARDVSQKPENGDTSTVRVVESDTSKGVP